MSTAIRTICTLGVVFVLTGCNHECRLDNSDLWRPDDHGDYNCLGECDTGSCQLEVLVDDRWQALNKTREQRDVVDERAGQPIPTEAPTEAPDWVRCNCY